MLLFLIGMLFTIKILNKSILMLWFQNMLFLLVFLFIIYLMNMKFYNFWLFINMNYGMDKISMMMVLLSLWILGLMILSILSSLGGYYYLYLIQKVILLVSLIMFFFSLNIINFYLFFEMSLIPVLLMILGWGSQPERMNAGVYMMMYTLFSSLPFFLLLMYINLNFFSLDLYLLTNMNFFMFYDGIFIYLFLIFIFMVKLPVYLFHLWLPKAHVEAPIFGSMVLAGVMLKLGGYGLIRFILVFSKLMNTYKLIMIIYILIGSVIISVLCMRQIDLKMLIAYSSVVHMGFMVGGLLSNYELTLKSNLSMMMAHGVCSSALFCLLNFNYKRVGSRMLMMNKSLNQFFVNMSMWWFLFCVMNMAAPPSLNLVSEVMLIILLLKYSCVMMIFIFLISFFGGVYSIYMFSYTQHGTNYFYKSMFNYSTVDEYLLMILHWIPMNMFILNLMLF
uniref:NADH-ubiquinone oxidoreductase chain 4 n=1 Tax=Ceratobaeus sp. MM-2013 TaxID=1429432 RepID=A0A067YFY5_9HYME|nr:NADH dehydrogenase subunit 4 [Ceratobaeus sp. MM-2013]